MIRVFIQSSLTFTPTTSWNFTIEVVIYIPWWRTHCNIAILSALSIKLIDNKCVVLIWQLGFLKQVCYDVLCYTILYYTILWVPRCGDLKFEFDEIMRVSDGISSVMKFHTYRMMVLPEYWRLRAKWMLLGGKRKDGVIRQSFWVATALFFYFPVIIGWNCATSVHQEWHVF